MHLSPSFIYKVTRRNAIVLSLSITARVVVELRAKE
jgi:hypothetical protein